MCKRPRRLITENEVDDSLVILLNSDNEVIDIICGDTVKQPNQRIKKRGTVILVFVSGGVLYVASDSRLSGHFYRRVIKDGVETRVKVDAGVSRQPKGGDGIRMNVEQIGKKLFTSDQFTLALAGTFGTAVVECEKILELSDKKVVVDHEYLVRRLGNHLKDRKNKVKKSESDSSGSDTDIIVATPIDVAGKKFEISHVSPKETKLVSDDFYSTGSGEDFAYKFMEKKMMDFNLETKAGVVEMLKQCVYYVAQKTSSVGGRVIVTVTELEDCGESKRFKTDTITFPSDKKVWTVSILPDGIHLPRDHFWPVLPDGIHLPRDDFTQVAILKQVLDIHKIDNIIEVGELEKGFAVRQDIVRVRIYKDSSDLFYQSSKYLVSTSEDYTDRTLVLGYNSTCDSFTIGPGCDDDYHQEFQEFCNSIAGNQAKMFWDNEQAAFVVWAAV